MSKTFAPYTFIFHTFCSSRTSFVALDKFGQTKYCYAGLQLLVNEVGEAEDQVDDSH